MSFFDKFRKKTQTSKKEIKKENKTPEAPEEKTPMEIEFEEIKRRQQEEFQRRREIAWQEMNEYVEKKAEERRQREIEENRRYEEAIKRAAEERARSTKGESAKESKESQESPKSKEDFEIEFKQKLDKWRSPEIDGYNDSIDAVLNSSAFRSDIRETINFRDQLKREKMEEERRYKEAEKRAAEERARNAKSEASRNNYSFSFNNKPANEESSYITVYQNSSGKYGIQGSEISRINSDIILRDYYKYGILPVEINKLPPEYINIVKDDNIKILEVTDDILLSYSLKGQIFSGHYDEVMSKFYNSVNNLNTKKSK